MWRKLVSLEHVAFPICKVDAESRIVGVIVKFATNMLHQRHI